jgi:hypothetical protein
MKKLLLPVLLLILLTSYMKHVPTGKLLLQIGDDYQGGKVAYILQSGDPGYDANVQHGLIAAATDQANGATWTCGEINTRSGANDTALLTGNQNTINIMSGCATAGIAARLCGDLELNGYSDWYLPSKDELNKLYINREAIGHLVGGAGYWSSSEAHTGMVWIQAFGGKNTGMQLYANKILAKCRVRAVRAF